MQVIDRVVSVPRDTTQRDVALSGIHKKKVGIWIWVGRYLGTRENASLIVVAIAGRGTWESWHVGTLAGRGSRVCETDTKKHRRLGVG